MEQNQTVLSKMAIFLNTDKSHLVQSSLALILPDSNPILSLFRWNLEFCVPRCGTNIFGLRAAEEKTRRTQYDFLCIVIWLLEILILNWFNV